MNAANKEPSGPDTMNSRLPDVARRLRDFGVHQVNVTYQAGPLLGMAFINANDEPMWVPRGDNDTARILDVIHALLKERLPTLDEGSSGSGVFKWNLVDDVLEHRHIQFGL